MEKELLDSLKTALSNEIAGEEFYNKTAEESADEFTKNTFIHLASDEIYHIERITEFIESGKSGTIEKEIRDRNPKSALLFFQMSEKQFNEHKSKFKGSLAPYRLAIDIEIKSYNIYKTLFDKSKNKKTKDFFAFLMKEELSHRRILEEAMAFLESPQDYFLKTEKWNFD